MNFRMFFVGLVGVFNSNRSLWVFPATMVNRKIKNFLNLKTGA